MGLLDAAYAPRKPMALTLICTPDKETRLAEQSRRGGFSLVEFWRVATPPVRQRGGFGWNPVRDTLLAAAMLARGWTHLLTFNVGDLRRYAPRGIPPVHPADV